MTEPVSFFLSALSNTIGELLADQFGDSLSAWAGCVAGAVEAKEYIAMMESVGFTDISIKPVFFDKQTVDSALDEMKLDVTEYPRDAVYKAVYSAKITAYKSA